MANGFSVRIESAVTDGANIFFAVKISSPTQTLELVRPVFPAGTAASVIDTYMQKIADTGPALTAAISVLVGKSYTGA